MTTDDPGGHIEACARMLDNRLRKRHKHLRKWARRRDIACYRLYDRDIPEVPLAIDIYHVPEAHLHVSRYERERERPDASPDDWLRAMVHAAANALDVPERRVHVKQRRRQRGRSQYRRVADVDRFAVVAEGGHRFAVNLDDYVDTGLFLDHRPLRARVQREAHGRRFLNLFCYTGAFTVYAARGGARASVSVDLSRRYLDRAGHNFALNGIDSHVHELVRADVREFLRGRARERFDLAVVDPPTFSNSKAMVGVLDIQRDHVEMIARTLDRLDAGGVLYFSTNYRRFKLDARQLCAPGRVRDITDITQATIPEDFRDRRIHRCFRIVK